MSAIKIGNYYITKNDPRFLLRKVAELTNENQELKKRQNEFLKWLENKIIEHKNLFFGEEEQNECLSITREAFKLALLNYKKIVGGKDENNVL